jgi:glycosyltransferase 2 family protein
MTEDTSPPADTVETREGRGKGHPLWLVLKTAISIGLIVIIFLKLDLASVWAKSRQLPLTLILAVVLLLVVQVCIAACRWWVIMHHQHLGIRLVTTVRISFVGAFFNQLLPSSIGGDVARAWYVYRNGCNKGLAVIAVLSDRIYGMLLLVCLAIVLFPVLVHFSVDNAVLVVLAVVILTASSALIAVFLLDRLPAWIKRWTVVRHLGSLSQAQRAIAADRRACVPVLGLSLIVHVITILATLLLLAAVAPQPNLLFCAALVPTITLLATIPVSIAGWGVRESLMIYGLGLASVPKEAALVVSIVLGLSLAAVGALGGIAWLIESYRVKLLQRVA